MLLNRGIPRIGAINRSHSHARGLVSCWRVMPDMERGAKWYDLAGKNHGTLTNGPTWLSDSLNFDGTNDYVTFGNTLNPGTSDYSYGCTFRTISSSGSNRVIMGKRDTSATTLAGWLVVFVPTTGLLITQHCDGSTDRVSVAGSTTVNNGQWRHLAVSCTRSGSMVTYIDGSVYSSASIAAQAGSVSPTAPALLGIQYDAGAIFTGGAFMGQVKDSFFYNRAISATEVKSLYTDPLYGLNRVRVPVGRVAAATSSKLLLRLASEGLFVGSHY